MKYIYINSKECFFKKAQNVIAKSLICFFLAFFSSSSDAQISRTQMINTANAYTSFTWTAYANNCISGGYYCSTVGRNIFAPTLANSSTLGWVIVGSNTSMPYCWGGWSTQSQHIGQMSTSTNTQAGDICPGDCTPNGIPLSSAPLSCASGHDCSGLVTLAWGITSKQSTTTLETKSTSIALTATQAGDIFNIAGDHTRLVYVNNGFTITVIEASGRDWKCAYHTYTPLQLSLYDPRSPKSNIVIDGTSGLSSNSNSTRITIYPNPTTDMLTIKSKYLVGDLYKIILTNNLGQIFYEKYIKITNQNLDTQVDIKELSSGIYFLIINSASLNQVFKVKKL